MSTTAGIDALIRDATTPSSGGSGGWRRKLQDRLITDWKDEQPYCDDDGLLAGWRFELSIPSRKLTRDGKQAIFVFSDEALHLAFMTKPTVLIREPATRTVSYQEVSSVNYHTHSPTAGVSVHTVNILGHSGQAIARMGFRQDQSDQLTAGAAKIVERIRRFFDDLLDSGVPPAGTDPLARPRSHSGITDGLPVASSPSRSFAFESPDQVSDDGHPASSGTAGGSSRPWSSANGRRMLMAAAAAVLLGGVAAGGLFTMLGGDDAPVTADEVPNTSGEPAPPSPSDNQGAADGDDAPAAVFGPAIGASEAVWRGQGYSAASGATYDVVLRLSADGTGGAEGQAHVTSTGSGRSGSWYVSGTVTDGSIMLEPGKWISRPNDQWVRDSFRLTLDDAGSLEGEAIAEAPVGSTWGLSLDPLVRGGVDSSAVADNWRVALVVPESEARGMLQDLRDTDLRVRDGLSGSWVPQVSSACPGLRTDLGPLTNSGILARHARALREYGAITVNWDDIGTATPDSCPTETMWVALVPEAFGDSEGALRWCRSEGIGRDDCAARLLTARGQSGTEIAYQD